MNVRLNSLIEAVLTFVISINWERGYCFCAVKPRQTTLIMTKNLTQALYFWKSGFFVCGKMWLCLENGMNSLTCQLVNSRTDTRVNSLTCQFLGANFNIMSACFSHQLSVRPQKNRFSRRFVLMQNGGCCKCEHNEYLFNSTAIYTNFWAISSKM